MSVYVRTVVLLLLLRTLPYKLQTHVTRSVCIDHQAVRELPSCGTEKRTKEFR
jgi:hypothetical protein